VSIPERHLCHLWSARDARVPMAGNARALGAASLGQAPPLVDVGMTRELMPAASSGQRHVRAGRGLPTPCRRGDRLHVSQPRIDRRGWRYRQRQVKQVMPCLNQTAVHLAQPGASHRSMARVRVPARWLWDRGTDFPNVEKRGGNVAFSSINILYILFLP
jgi:hypothetical protein